LQHSRNLCVQCKAALVNPLVGPTGLPWLFRDSHFRKIAFCSRIVETLLNVVTEFGASVTMKRMSWPRLAHRRMKTTISSFRGGYKSDLAQPFSTAASWALVWAS
jgi:hypothetical protein